MKNKASVLTLRIPGELKHRIERLAEEQGVSINQLALYIFTRQVTEMEAGALFARRYRDKDSRQIVRDFDVVLEKVKEGSIPDWDAT